MSPERKKAEVPNGRNENRKPKAGARKIIAALLLAIGLIFILVPLVTTHINTRRNEDIIDQFLKEAEMAMSESSDISSDGKTLPEPDIQSEPSATKNPQKMLRLNSLMFPRMRRILPVGMMLLLSLQPKSLSCQKKRSRKG